jgi:hypothetical protein
LEENLRALFSSRVDHPLLQKKKKKIKNEPRSKSERGTRAALGERMDGKRWRKGASASSSAPSSVFDF